jgi:hypothetical protein
MTTSRNWYAAFGNVDKFLIYYGTIISIVMLPTLLTRNGISILWSISWRTFEIMTLMYGRKKNTKFMYSSGDRHSNKYNQILNREFFNPRLHIYTCIPYIFCWV